MATAASDALLQLELGRAKLLADDARYEEALDILDDYLEQRLPAEATKFVTYLRSKLTAVYAARFPSRDIVVRQTAAAEQLRKFDLRAKHVYLWSLCGEGTSIDDIIDLSPMHPIDSLRTLTKLFELGLIAEADST